MWDNPMFLFLFFLFCWVLEVIATVITSPYQFLFRFCAKSKEVVFGEFATLFLFLRRYKKNSYSRPERHFELQIYEHLPQVII